MLARWEVRTEQVRLDAAAVIAREVHDVALLVHTIDATQASLKYELKPST